MEGVTDQADPFLFPLLFSNIPERMFPAGPMRGLRGSEGSVGLATVPQESQEGLGLTGLPGPSSQPGDTVTRRLSKDFAAVSKRWAPAD